MKAREALHVITIAVTLGCAKSTVQQEATVVRPTVAPSDSTTRTASAADRVVAANLFRPGNVTYEYRSTSTVQVTMGDTIPRVDTSTVTGLISAFFQPTNNLTIQVHITTDSTAVHTGGNSPIRFTPHTDTLTINTVTGKVGLVAQQRASCDIQGQDALVPIDDVVPTLPSAQTGICSDTLVRQICRAGIQLQARRVRTYQLDSSTADFRLLRTTTTTFGGRGIQWSQPVEAAGQSISTDTLFLDLTSRRRIDRIRGSARLQLNFTAQLRNQQFEQLTKLFIQVR